MTGIDEEFLTGKKSLKSASIAKRMSWAASRTTTRPEDIAYSLIGIFLINMPMLYGEGGRAFLRLQEEIMKVSDDQSLFAWTDEEASDDTHYGLLARHPSCFRHSRNIVPYQDWGEDDRDLFSMSNRGVRIEVDLSPLDGINLYKASLRCLAASPSRNASSLAIYLEKAPAGISRFARVKARQLSEHSGRAKSTVVYVQRTELTPDVKNAIIQEVIAFGQLFLPDLLGWKLWAYVPVDSRARHLVKVEVSHEYVSSDRQESLHPFLPSCEIINRNEKKVCCALRSRN